MRLETAVKQRSGIAVANIKYNKIKIELCWSIFVMHAYQLHEECIQIAVCHSLVSKTSLKGFRQTALKAHI